MEQPETHIKTSGAAMRRRPQQLAAIESADRRTKIARRMREVARDIAYDLDPVRGPDGLSTLQLEMIKRISCLSVWCSQCEDVVMRGGKIDVELYNRIAGGLKRLCDSLGYERTPRDVTEIQDPLTFARSYRNDDDD